MRLCCECAVISQQSLQWRLALIKWSEFREGDVLYEAFHPEHEQEGCAWLLRASCRGHILSEQHLRMTWPPRFGPDAGDVAAVEALAEKMVETLSTIEIPQGEGAYVPSTSTLPPAEPHVHAVLYALVDQYAQSADSIGLNAEESAAYLELSGRPCAKGLFPAAVTPERDSRMRRLIALDHALRNQPEVLPIRRDLMNAVLASDIPGIRELLRSVGLEPGSD